MHESAYDLSFEEAVRDFCDDQEYKGNSRATVRYYRSNLGRFRRDTETATLADFTERRIRRWLVSHKDVSSATLATYDRSLRVFARWLHHRGYVAANPMDRLSKPRTKTKPITTFTRDEVREMLRVAKAKRNPLRDTALITLLLDTGLRIGEATGLRLQDIDWRQGWLSVDGKSGPRQVPFGNRTRICLKRYVDQGRRARDPSVRAVFLERGGVPLTPEAATHHIAKIAKAANAQASKMGPHTFRHTFAVEFIRAGGDAFSLQRLLGHTTLEMTRRYVHLAQTDLRTAHKRFSPTDSWTRP